MSLALTEAVFFKNFIKTANDMYLRGWNERNGGNLSYRLSASECEKACTGLKPQAGQKLMKAAPELAGEVFLLTGSGKFFRNIILDPEDACALIRLNNRGDSWELLWGLSNGGRPTSELPAHLLAHAACKRNNPLNQVIMHCHTPNLIALTFIERLNAAHITGLLWQMMSECLIVFPKGVGVMPWMLPGGVEIGETTAATIADHNLALWPHHGVFGCGNTLDETFGLIDTAEKAAAIWLQVKAHGGPLKGQTISGRQLRDLAAAFCVDVNEAYLPPL